MSTAATCDNCGIAAAATAAETETETQRLRFCSRCMQRKYCGQTCQRAAWRAGHKEECKRLRASSSSSSASVASSVSSSSSSASAFSSSSSSAATPSADGRDHKLLRYNIAAASRSASVEESNGLNNTSHTNAPAASSEAEHANPTSKTHTVPGDNKSKKKSTGVVRSMPRPKYYL